MEEKINGWKKKKQKRMKEKMNMRMKSGCENEYKRCMNCSFGVFIYECIQYNTKTNIIIVASTNA